jgi:hypothetical protein
MRLETYLGLAQVEQSITDRLHLSAVLVFALLVTLLLAWMTYFFVEKPIRKSKRINVIAPVLLLISVVCLPLYLFVHIAAAQSSTQNPELSAFLERYSIEQNSEFQRDIIEAYRFDCSFLEESGQVRLSLPQSCYQASTRPVLMLWGDSHAAHLRPGLDALLQKIDTSNYKAVVVQMASGSCVPSLQQINPGNSVARACNLSNDLALKTISQLKPEVLIIAQASDYFKTNWGELIAAVKKLGAGRVIVVGPVPRWRDDLPRLIAYRYWPSVPKRLSVGLRQEFFDIDKELKHIITGFPGVTYISAIDYFCNTEGCLVSVGDDKLALTTYDQGHLTPEASRHFIFDAFTPFIPVPVAPMAVH